MDNKKSLTSKNYVNTPPDIYTHKRLYTTLHFLTILWLMTLTTLSAWGQQNFGGGIVGIVNYSATVSHCQVGAGVEISVAPNQLGTQQSPNQELAEVFPPPLSLLMVAHHTSLRGGSTGQHTARHKHCHGGISCLCAGQSG